MTAPGSASWSSAVEIHAKSGGCWRWRWDEPGGEVAAPPAHHAVEGRIGAGLDDLGQLEHLLVT